MANPSAGINKLVRRSHWRPGGMASGPAQGLGHGDHRRAGARSPSAEAREGACTISRATDSPLLARPNHAPEGSSTVWAIRINSPLAAPPASSRMNASVETNQPPASSRIWGTWLAPIREGARSGISQRIAPRARASAQFARQDVRHPAAVQGLMCAGVPGIEPRLRRHAPAGGSQGLHVRLAGHYRPVSPPLPRRAPALGRGTLERPQSTTCTSPKARPMMFRA